MRNAVTLFLLAAAAFGALTILTPAPEAAPPCIQCPDVPVPSECPACYAWVPETCRQCGHCERIRGCKT